jgi:uncharacterized protein with ParB-like and HNH nuclease domain
MIQHVDKYPLYQIFDKDSKLSFVVPKYQREYTWGYAEWEALYTDINENDLGYFIGSIICINQGDAINPKCEVIDGQQRLTTLSILLAAIYTELVKYKQEMQDDEDKLVALIGIKKSLSCDSSENQLKLLPQIQNSNRDDYNYLMKSEACINNLKDQKAQKLQKPAYYGQRKMARCFRYFSSKIAEDIVDVADDCKADALFDIYEKIKQTMLVKIEVNSHSDAYVLFESLNNRGVSLTAIDLMKNMIMARADKFNLKTDDCYENWKILLSNISDDYKTQERFFRHYYNAFKTELNEPFKTEDSKNKNPLGYIATKSNLLSIYEKLINRDLPKFIDEIIDASELYKRFLHPELFKAEFSYAAALISLNHIQGVPSYILLIYLLRNQQKLAITDTQITIIINYLVSFFVRRNLTDYPGTKDLARIFMSIIEQIDINQVTDTAIVQLIYNKLKDVCASDELFLKSLSGDIYTDNSEAARFVLCALAEEAMTKETWTDLWKRSDKSGNYIWTIEHIFPEGENVPQPWVNMIANGDAVLAKEHLHNYTHKLGNLTMTGYNSSLSNLDFIEKRERTNKEGKFVGYKNGLEINEELAKRDDWHIEDIKERTERLATNLVNKFKL